VTRLYALLLLMQLFRLSAQDSGAERMSPTFFLSAKAGINTSKSEFVESNDTGYGMGYTLGFHAGSERQIGILFATDRLATTYTLNDAAMSTTWQDTIIRYRLDWFYLGIIMGRVSMTAESGTGAATAFEYDVEGSGYGFNTGIVTPLMRSASFYLDIRSVSIGATREAAIQDITFGPRLDVDFGVAFHVSRSAWDILAGLTRRSYSITAASTGNEVVTGTYLGFNLNSFF
jgi:hypothetical protein